MLIQGFLVSDIISIFGVCISIAALWLTWRTLMRKSLSYESSSFALLRQSFGQVDLQFSINGVPVDDLHIAEVSILNDGNVAIEPKDFYEPIVISLSKETSIVSVDIRALQNGLSIDATNDGCNLTLHPFLINPGDKVLVRMLVSSRPDKIALLGRISGISRISLLHPYSRLLRFALYGSFLCIMFSIGLWLAKQLGVSDNTKIIPDLLLVGTFLFVLVLQSRPVITYRSPIHSL